MGVGLIHQKVVAGSTRSDDGSWLGATVLIEFDISSKANISLILDKGGLPGCTAYPFFLLP